MKFMMNGALTIGTRDGATIEMAAAAGEEHFFLFGLTAQQVADSRGTYNPQWHYDHEPETRAALDLIGANHFSPNEPGVFEPILDALLRWGDHYLHLADLGSYADAHTRLGEVYADQETWSRKAVLNIAASGRFSSDRTIAEYARDIWGADTCPVE
jgi:starch phosphorylase